MKILYDQLIHCDLTGIMECMSHISESITDPDILISNIDHIKLSEYYLGLINNLQWIKYINNVYDNYKDY